MDSSTVERLVREHPEGYRGGKIDASRPVGQLTSTVEAWANAERCLANDNPSRAAYWAGMATEGER